jgi:regulator of vacuolar morphogenesis
MQTLFTEQDARLESLSAVIRRQKELGMAIGAELGEQNEMLDDLNSNVDQFGRKMKKADKQMKRLGH